MLVLFIWVKEHPASHREGGAVLSRRSLLEGKSVKVFDIVFRESLAFMEGSTLARASTAEW